MNMTEEETVTPWEVLWTGHNAEGEPVMLVKPQTTDIDHGFIAIDGQQYQG